MDTTILDTMSRQIGSMNILAISGGRRVAVDEVTLHLPVSHGYRVAVTYDRGTDTYNVAREMKRGAKVFQKGHVDRVYADQLGEVAYQASCYRNVEFGS